MRPVIVIGVLAALAVAAALAFKYGARRLDGIVASTIERYGSAVTGTDVNVDGVTLALTAGRADLAGVTIENPRGYDTDFAVHVGRASVELDVGSLASDVPIVEELVLDGVLINAEQRDTGSNLTDIQRHAAASSGEEPAGEAGRIIIERFRLEDARVLLASEHLSKPEELPLRDVVVENIGGTTGATYSEAAEAMLMPVLSAARTAAAARLRQVAGEAVSDAAREELEEESEALRERTDDARREVSEKLEELRDRG